ncbi:MAG: hypothetical protein UY26_C0002G0039 [Candidatus Jorgensenbacteria bacterium GW2011_GWA1_48_13]|uniref:Uncharacterized protein n=2 Tax=Candidatus Joergenseniibacteriota TaxID=1752739 RepID=A0A0G1W9J6_9BACT|nr:MAG: hypothetical protein UY26_C0002G0039 [Candidatus Jorgensenbacteria bacterium GW2011_GWA1_48_13]KKU99119.1 MAG: hypothetical protein UY32_C0006G0035 [Candidatus Jorgensenbacteria bacterium GW2011_GWC1_48_8]KKW15471.1 MAG: hypothetical protein UY55_C0001G0225 [Candidatus Jorgensenbacteria bacterium GW2011_GWB1_50_10]
MRKGWDLWAEGKYFDFWSVNHFLSGVMVAAALLLLNVSFWPAFVIAFLIFVAYELFEVALQIGEHMTNRVTDIVVDVAGFFAAAYIFLVLQKPLSVTFLVIIVLLILVLTILGYDAWVKRTKRRGKEPVDIKEIYK